MGWMPKLLLAGWLGRTPPPPPMTDIEAQRAHLEDPDLTDSERAATLHQLATLLSTGEAGEQVEAVTRYQQVLGQFPRYEHCDQVTFELALTLSALGRTHEAMDTHTQLVRRYPESEHVPAAYVQLGEFYFGRDNVYKALLAYRKAARTPGSPVFEYAHYKLAWCYYNIGEYEKAIEAIKVAVSSPPLRDEALMDLARFYLDAGQPDAAADYIQSLAIASQWILAHQAAGVFLGAEGLLSGRHRAAVEAVRFKAAGHAGTQ